MTKPELLTPEQLQEIAEREANATSGPWAWDNRGEKCYIEQIAETITPTDAEFIAHARADITAMLGHIQALTEQRDRWAKAALGVPRTAERGKQ